MKKYKNIILGAVAYVAFMALLVMMANSPDAKAKLAYVKRIESSWLNVKKGTMYPHYDRATQAGVVWTYVSTDDNRWHNALIKDGWVIEKDGKPIPYHPDCCDN